MGLKLIYFDHFASASEYYRSMPLDYIKHPDIEITRSTERDITSHLLNKYDVIVILRASSSEHFKIIKLAKDLKKFVLIDYDDNVLHVPETNPMYGHYAGDKGNIINCLALADEVWVATNGIKQAFRLYNKNIHVVPNSHNDHLFSVEDKPSFKYGKIAMWRGGGSHSADIYYPAVAENIVKLINANRKWKFYWLGARFEWIDYRVKYGNMFYNPGASTIQFYKMMHKINPSVFFYPLVDNQFNRGKSNCSFLESVYSGAAYFGNMNLPEIQLPGVRSLSQVGNDMKDPDKLQRNHEDSWEFIKSNLLLSDINKIRLNRLLSI
jgi:hypothetical protein